MPQFNNFSEKQLKALTWWMSPGAKDMDGIICSGAVRSGKTTVMGISFIAWATASFNDTAFGICGKSAGALERNVITPLLPLLRSLGFICDYKPSKDYMVVSRGKRKNRFYFFGGANEASAALVQGITLGGVLFDEVALLPKSFVEQALARCSVSGSKFFFNCNPESPNHWFYKEWILRHKEKNMLYLHFKMQDNPALSPEVIQRYESMYSGVFYERFVLGNWVVTDGLIYPMFSPSRHLREEPEPFEEYILSCDYGTMNPFSLGLWGRKGSHWHRVKEYYHNGRESGTRLTDAEYYEKLTAFIEDRPITALIIDPAASSFIETVRRNAAFPVIKARNDVLPGINAVSEALNTEKISFSPECKDTVREFGLYRWADEKEGEAPLKENDHAMDDIRYFVATVIGISHSICWAAVEREPDVPR